METHTLYSYSNSSTRNGACMDSPPPPYTGGGDLSFEGVKFSVVGSGRKVVPCHHCRRDLGTFETLLLHSEGLKKGSVRNEVIFMVNILERYNATGNYELADVRPPLYQIPRSSHFGAEYCRHCNQADSLANKPLSCASTRVETSSHDSFSDVEQFSNSLDENTPPTNKYVSKYDHSEEGSQEDNPTNGPQHQNGQPHTTAPEEHRQHTNSSQRHQDYISNSNSNRDTQHRKRSSSPPNKTNKDSQSNLRDFTTPSQTDYIHRDSPEYFSASYPDEFTNESKISLKNNKLKSMTTIPYQSGPHYPAVTQQQNEVFFAEDVKKLKDRMSSKINDVLKKKKDTKSPYIDNRWRQDQEALRNDLLTDPKMKNIINDLVEHSLKSLISNNREALSDTLKDSENKILSRKGDIPPPLKIDTCDDVELNQVCVKESVAEKPPDYHDKDWQNEDKFTSNKKGFKESAYISCDNKSYSPTLQKVDINTRNNNNVQNTPDIIQTPANDSGFFSPSPKIISNLSPWEREHNESGSFRHSSCDISTNVVSPDAKITGKWKTNQYTDYSNADINSEDTSNNNVDQDNDDNDDDDDDTNVTNSCKTDVENDDCRRNMTYETSSETTTVCSTSSAYINDEENDDYDYDVTNPVMSPRGSYPTSSPLEPWYDFRRSISPDSLDCNSNNGNDNPSPDQTFCSHKQKFRRTSGEEEKEDNTQPTTASPKKNFTTFEKIENTPIIYQETPKTFNPPRHSRVTLSSPDSPEWDPKAADRVSNKCVVTSSSNDSSKRAEKREGEKPHDSGDISVAKRLYFDDCSSPPVTDSTSAVTVETDENIPKTSSHSLNETNLTDTATRNQLGSQQNEDTSGARQNSQPSPPPCVEKVTKTNPNINASLQKNESPTDNTRQKQPRRVKINDKRPAEPSCKVNKEGFPLKEPDLEALTTCKARAILQSLETSTKSIGTYTPFELENVCTKSSSQNLLFTGGPFQADQNYRSWLADIVCNKNGQYIVSDWSNCCVQMFSTAGLPGDRVTFTSGPWGLALMSENIVACTVPHAKQIALLSHGSRLIVVRLVSTARRYWGIAVSKNQTLVCSCTQGIDLLTPNGKILRTVQYNEVGLEFFVFPQYLTVGNNGVIYVSDSCGTYLIGLPEDGEFSFSFKPLNGIKLKMPRAIKYGRDGYVYIADTDTDKIYRLTEDGTLDSELFTAADNVHGPLAITLHDNTMIVTQKDSSILILPI